MTLDQSTGLLLVITSFASLEDAKKMARQLIDAHLVACVQIQEGVHSIYRWEGRISEVNEVLLSAKTITSKWIDVSSFIKSHHPYDLPEIIAFAPDKWEERYGMWVQAEVK